MRKQIEKIEYNQRELPSWIDDQVIDAFLKVKDKLNELVKVVNLLSDNKK